MRKKLVKLAMLQLKKKYVWSKRGPNEFDCSGFTWYLYNELFGIDINENGFGLSTTTKQLTSPIGVLNKYDISKSKNDYIESINPGDILLFHSQSKEDTCPKIDNKYPGHCAIYLGDYKLIHASSRSKEVIIANFDERKKLKKILVASKNIITSLI